MRDLPFALRCYLITLYLGCGLLIGAQVGPIVLGAWHAPALWQMFIFVLLAYLADRNTLSVCGPVDQSLGTAVQITTILIFPLPIPLVITLAAMLLSEAQPSRLPWYKRLYNVSHSILNVGLSSLLFSLVATPPVALRPDHVVSSFLALSLLLAVYHMLDVSPMMGVLALLERRSLWQVWRQTSYHTMIPELTAGVFGILAAVVWLYHPLLLVLLAAPLATLQVAFRAIGRAERRGEQLEAVLRAGQRLRVHQAPADLLLPIAEAARAMTRAGAVAAYLRDPDDPAMLERMVLAPDDATAAGPARRPVPAPGGGVRRDDGAAGRTLLVPLEQDEAGVVGLLRLIDVPATPSADDCDALAILATQAAIALENARMHQRALEQASQDGLTGLLNHRAFQVRLEEEVARARRGGHPLALALVDLDDFGAVNNTYGHQAGDTALAAVAGALRKSVRVADVVARYGGDEFAVILPETDTDEAIEVATRARAAIGALTIGGVDARVRISASLGVAATPAHATTREELIRAADDATYAAKRAGKNGVGRPEEAALPRDPYALAARLEHANMVTVEALAAAVDAKDAYTRGHSQRVSGYAVAIAEALGLGEADVARIRMAGLLHDVGKIGVPDAILTKPGALSTEEFAVIKQHPVIGERMLAAVPFLGAILPAVRHHHERWDGRGYPDGLAGAVIPEDASILMVADAFDAMTSSRTYRPALPVSEAYRRVREGSGTQFEPRMVAAFEQGVVRRQPPPIAARDGTARLAGQVA